MNALSLVVSFLSVAAAVVAGVLAVRVLRDERRRSAARVAALSRMSGPAGWDHAGPAFLPESAFLPERNLHAANDPVPADAPSGLFEAPSLPSGAGRLAAAAMIGAVALAAVAIATLGWNGRAHSSAGIAAAAPAPLELLSLGHSKAAGSLTVNGRVQNPKGSSAADGLTATVFLFGADGAFLTSGRASLEAATLAAGAAAPFVVTIPVNGEVARYRVSFRNRAGHAVAHLDKRAPASLARSEGGQP